MPLLESSRIEMINANDIIDGNPIKKLMILHTKALSKNTDDASSDYIEYCKTLPVSIVLDHSDIIFSDSRYGLSFYKNMIENSVLPFHVYGNELEKLEKFISKVNDFSEEEKVDYNSLVSLLTMKKALYMKGCAPFSEKLSLCDDTDDLMSDIFDAINNRDRCPQFDLESSVHTLLENKYAFFLYGPLLYSVIEDDYSLVARLNRLVNPKCVDFSDFVETLDSIILVSIFAQDQGYTEICEECRNRAFREKIMDIMYTKVSPFMQSVMKPDNSVDITPTIPNGVDELSYLDSIADLCKQDKMTSMVKGERQKLLGELYSRFAGHLSTIWMFTEYDPRDRYSYTGEIPFETTTRNLYDLIQETERQLCPIMESFGCDLYDDTFFEASKDDEEDIDKEIDELDNEEEEEPPADDADVDEEEPEDEEPKEDKPKKEKKSLFQSMTNRAMDREKKNLEQKEKMKEASTTVKNYVKAETAIPKHVLGEGKNLIESIRIMDKKRLTKKMMKDGWRSNLWKKIIRFTKYGAVAMVSPLLVPVFWFARTVSKTKNKRLRDDIIKDFDLELDVLQEKYQNARDDHKTKEAIKIKRLIDKVARERDRIKYNTKVLS